MARALTSDELNLLRSDEQWSRLYLAFLVPNTIYTARLASLPSSFDQVAEISVNTESGTLSDVKAGMTLYVGTTAGAHDLGMCRIRKTPITGTFYIGEISEIDWQSSCYLTIVDDFDVWAKHLHVESDGTLRMDVDVAYSDQHVDFDPVPVLGSHAVLWLTGASVSVDFDASDSWVFDSTISAYAWTAPGSSASSGMATATPTITYNAAGIYRVYCTVTAANGKTTFGVRYVFVFDDDNPPATVFQLSNCEGSQGSGGWMFDLTMEAEASLSEIRERTLCILFAKDYYQNTEQSIGPLEGRENIIAVGRISGESIRWDSVAGQVHFTVYGPHYWMNILKTNPCALNFTADTPASWDQMPEMTVDRALWHLLHWRSNAIQIMDFYPTNDTRFAGDFASLSNFLWPQLNEFAGLKILANVLCNRYGQLFAEIEPQLVPEADRDWPTVMSVTKNDWMESIEFGREEVTEVSQLNITTRYVNTAGDSITLYSLSPGHIPKRYGDWELHDGILAASQAQSNQLAGLILAWKTNEFKNIPIRLAQNNRMVDICPRQFLALSIAVDDTPRGIAFDGNLIPRRMVLRYDQDNGSLVVEISCEAETFEQVSANGDIPGSGEADVDLDIDLSIPPIPPLPKLPDFPIILPGDISSGSSGPSRVLIHDVAKGFIYTENFDSSSPSWIQVNGGLTSDQYQTGIVHVWQAVITPSGVLYISNRSLHFGANPDPFIWRATAIGQSFSVIENYTSIESKHGIQGHVTDIGMNPFLPDTVAYCIGGGTSAKVYLGTGGSFNSGLSVAKAGGTAHYGSLSFGFNQWVLTGPRTGFLTPQHFWRMNAGATAIILDDDPGLFIGYHIRVGTSDILFHVDKGGGGNIIRSTGNCALFGPNLQNEYDDILIDNEYTMAVDPTGLLLMAGWQAHAGTRGKSSGAGVGWVGLPNLPYGGYYRYAYAGTGGSAASTRWIAAKGIIRYTPDFGTTWLNKEGNISSITATPDIDLVKVIG